MEVNFIGREGETVSMLGSYPRDTQFDSGVPQLEASICSTNIYNCLEVCFLLLFLKTKRVTWMFKKNVPVLSVIAVVSEFIA